ncbi:MAG: hypothetical protein LBV23_01635, partial [Deltaproteobacteria bacterium]|jgi:hypothetical protein|nr:hypothetical protein [Deltaproteobacteria bacterium]
MATAIIQRLQRDILSKSKKKDKISLEGVFMALRNQKCKVYAKDIIPQVPVKNVNAVYNLLGIDCPIKINRTETMLC